MATNNLAWSFPMRKFFFMRIETLTVAIIAVLMFILIFAQPRHSWLSAVFLTIAFIVFYYILSYIIQTVRKAEERYSLTPTHFEVVKKSRNKIKTAKINLKNIAKHKLDKTFLGGYLVTKAGRKHLLFFNTKKEVESFEDFIQKFLKRLKHKKVSVKKPVAKKISKKRVVKNKTPKNKVTKRRKR